MSTDPGEVTRLLRRSREGDKTALDALLPLVYADLRRIAGNYMRKRGPGHTLQPTALLHEAYLRLAEGDQPDWKDRTHFFAVTATVMRNILVDHARSQGAIKRGGGLVRSSFEEAFSYSEDRPADLVRLDDALKALAAFDARKARILELRYFGGLNIEETAEVLNLGVATVGRDTRVAEAWLRRELLGAEPEKF